MITVPWWNACAYYAVTLATGLARKGHRIFLAGKPGSPALVYARETGIQTLDTIHLHWDSPAFFFGTFATFVDS
jgi:hypothetical protein